MICWFHIIWNFQQLSVSAFGARFNWKYDICFSGVNEYGDTIMDALVKEKQYLVRKKFSIVDLITSHGYIMTDT